MKLIDLSHPLSNQTPVFPGSPGPEISTIATIEKDHFREKFLSIPSHISTHMDAPAHILRDGFYLDQMPIDSFYGRGLVVDVSGTGLPDIGPDALKTSEIDAQTDFILFYSGWQKHWATKKYFESSPHFSAKLAKELCELPLKGVGIDAISVDAIDSTELAAHNIVLGKNMVILENLNNLDILVNKPFMLAAFPLKIEQADGSPVRVVAILDNV